MLSVYQLLQQMPHRRPIKRRSPRGGYTLVEVVVALLISCIMVTAMFSVALTAKGGSGKSGRRIVANQASAQISSMLRGFVTGCGCNVNTGGCAADCALIPGPNTSNAGVATWYINGFGGITDDLSGGNVYALMAGVHNLRNVLPPWFEGPPYNGRVSYTVTVADTVQGRPVPRVDVNITWVEP